MSNNQYSKELTGRRKIYTDYDTVTDDNVIEILNDSLIDHELNRADIIFLLDFESGIQPLVRDKVVYPEIDINATLNLANQITEFNLGYFWGNPFAMVQKSDKLPVGSKSVVDNSAIAELNNMYYAENKDSKDQELARYVEICGIGYQMIDIKRNYDDGDSVFDLVSLNPLYTFVVHSKNVRREVLLGVTYSVNKNGTRTFTCISKDKVYIVSEQKQITNGQLKDKLKNYQHSDRSGEMNPLGEVYIIEYERSFDRTGCFEHQVEDMNAMNVLQSDLVNDVAQNTQAIWWGNNFEFEKDENDEPVGITNGQWFITHTSGNGTNPDIKPLVLPYDYAGVLQNIQAKHDYILENAYIPKQSDPGGGSTTSAMSLSSGWSATEAVACKKFLVLKKSFQLRNKLALKAIKKSPYIEPDNEILKLSANDIEVRPIRQKTFNLTEKVNSLATMLNCMVDPKTAMATIDLFGNLAEAVDDSIDNMRLLQASILEKNKAEETQPVERLSSDLSDQTANSPILKGSN